MEEEEEEDDKKSFIWNFIFTQFLDNLSTRIPLPFYWRGKYQGVFP